MFIGRTRELHTLNKAYASNKFEFVVIYGRRRVGKTALIKEFLQAKPSIYYMGVEGNERLNLENFSTVVLQHEQKVPSGAISFSSFQNALEYVFQLGLKERIILAIDEYPYLARSSDGFASVLQLLIDKYKDSSKVMLILCGSSMSYMEDQVLAYKAPLYGRRTAQIKLQPFDFFEFCAFFKGYSNFDLALLYGALGGTPQYMLQVDTSISVEENIKQIFLDPSSPLFEEPLNLLKQELREPALYNSVIAAIADGYTRISDISHKIGESTSACSAAVKNLIALGIINKETPYGDSSSKKAIYSIADNMYRFWYRFVPQNYSLINLGGSEIVYQRISPFFNEYMGAVFEDICKQYLWRLLLLGKAPINFSSLGRWWGNDPSIKKQAEIDIMAEQDKQIALFCECKWRNEAVNENILELLEHRSTLFRYKNNYYIIFSKSDFTDKCKSMAQAKPNVMLIDYADIVRGAD